MQGIVVDSNPVSSTKTALKAATFSLRKLPPQTSTTSISGTLLSAVDELVAVVPAKKGALLYALLPPDVRSGDLPFPNSGTSLGNEDSIPQILSAPTAERFVSYQSAIRSAFAHRGSVLLVVPTSPQVNAAYESLSHGIAERVIRFSSTQSKSERQKAYAAFGDLSRATLTIATPSFAYLDRPDFTSSINHCRCDRDDFAWTTDLHAIESAEVNSFNPVHARAKIGRHSPSTGLFSVNEFLRD